MNQKKKKQNPTRKMQKKATGHSTLSLPTLTHTELHTERTNTHSEREGRENLVKIRKYESTAQRSLEFKKNYNNQ